MLWFSARLAAELLTFVAGVEFLPIIAEIPITLAVLPAELAADYYKLAGKLVANAGRTTGSRDSFKAIPSAV